MRIGGNQGEPESMHADTADQHNANRLHQLQADVALPTILLLAASILILRHATKYCHTNDEQIKHTNATSISYIETAEEYQVSRCGRTIVCGRLCVIDIMCLHGGSLYAPLSNPTYGMQ